MTNKSQQASFGVKTEQNQLEFEKLIQLDTAYSHWANVPEADHRLFGLCRRPRPTRRIANLNEWRPGQQPRPRLQTMAYRSPAVAPEKTNMAVASPFLQPARSLKQHENRAIDSRHGEYAQHFDGCTAVAVPRVAFQGSLRPPKRP